MQSLLELKDQVIELLNKSVIDFKGQKPIIVEKPLTEVYKGIQLTKISASMYNLNDMGISIYGKCKYSWNNQVYEDVIMGFNMVQIPGCCGLDVSYHTNVRSEYNKKGIAQDLMQLKIEIAKHYNYSCLICTTMMSNVAQVHVLEKTGWKRLHTFRNKKTTNVVGIYTLDIRENDTASLYPGPG